jgi:hypothetical protein
MANTTGTRQKEEFKGTMQGAMDTARDVAGAAKDKAKEVASTVSEKARDIASTIGEKAEGAVSSVGSGIQSVAETIREKGPQSGVMGKATSTVASALDSSGRYLEEQGLGGMASDLTNLIRRNPLPALLLGIGLGYLLARLTRS